ncbi:hypothetical protein GQ54DRAFT_202828 [Martensiomyces pterosporus]|nr:hypothetical protein GQ54DRAFT_202828 [Martensiomyces pterosporus]
MAQQRRLATLTIIISFFACCISPLLPCFFARIHTLEMIAARRTSAALRRAGAWSASHSTRQTHKVTRRPLHVLASVRAENKGDSHLDPNNETAKDQSAKAKDQNEDDAVDLDSIFDMLQLPGQRASHAAPPSQPTDGANEQPTKPLSEKLRSEADSIYEEDDTDLDDLFRMFDAKPSAPEQPAHNAKSPATHHQDHDPMRAFERILSDLAAENTQVYKKDRPAPRFWDDDNGQAARKQDRKLKKALDPEELFKKGPRTSAFSAGKLASDPSRISSLAARIQKADRVAEKASTSAGPAPGASRAPGQRMAPLLSRDAESEQIQLSRLAQCQSLAALTKFVDSYLPADRLAGEKAEPAARPSPLVVAEVIKLAREFQEPYFAYYVYSYCRTELGLADKLRVLDAGVYQELLLTAWSSRRDFSAVTSLLRDAISVGITANTGLGKQIDKIVMDLHKEHNLPELAHRISDLKTKIGFEATSTTPDPASLASVSSRFSL